MKEVLGFGCAPPVNGRGATNTTAESCVLLLLAAVCLLLLLFLLLLLLRLKTHVQQGGVFEGGGENKYQR